MDKWQGLDSFWSSFGIPAYDENAVPDNAQMPYITYQASVGPFEATIPMSASVWYFDTSWKAVSNKVDEISNAIGSYLLVELDDNQYLMITKGDGSQFAQRINGGDNPDIRRVYITIMGEFFTRH